MSCSRTKALAELSGLGTKEGILLLWHKDARNRLEWAN
jgi:hypothetical protein